MFILDEADKMLQEGAMKQATLEILGSLPQTTQQICVSATYSPDMLSELDALIPEPERLLIPSGNPTLEGVKQYYLVAPEEVVSKGIGGIYNWKFEKLVSILKSISFHQCIVFCNAAVRSGSLVDKLNAQGWATRCISSQLSQKERLLAVEDFRSFRFRILLSSDLVARGLDIDRINLVINLDLPNEPETYLHRIGRTGRFGTFGVAINLLGGESDYNSLRLWNSTYESSLVVLPDVIPPDFYHYDLSESDKSAKERLERSEEKRRNHMLEAPVSRSKPSKKRKRQEEVHNEGQDEEEANTNPHMPWQEFSTILSTSQILPYPASFGLEQWYSTPWQQLVNGNIPPAPLPPPHPNEFWNSESFISYISSTYLPHLYASIQAYYDHP
jgi:superfamily II DNA/RNA helicase